MNRGGAFSALNKLSHFVECVGGTGGFFARKRDELHRDYVFAFPQGFT
jgi:hypothetical protein